MRLLFYFLLCICAVNSHPRSQKTKDLQRNRPIGTRIVGGWEAYPHQFPYQAALNIRYATGASFSCGGALVSSNYVLTAAHCLELAESVTVTLGAHALFEKESTQIVITSKKFLIHPYWDVETIVNDIGLVKLPYSVLENNYVKAIKVATGYNRYVGYIGVTSGWGKTSNLPSSVPKNLRCVSGKILSNDDCSDTLDITIQYSKLCLSGEGGVGNCNGDSGGPLAVDGKLVGVVSFGYPDCLAGKPTVYTRLTEYTEWLKRNSDIKF